MAGTDYELVSDMFEYTWELFSNIKAALQDNSIEESVLMNILNKENESNFVITHFKVSQVLTIDKFAKVAQLIISAYMSLRSDYYQNFMDMPLSDYRASRIDPSNVEIDEIGLQAFVHSIVEPAGLGLKVAYLDRSAGDTVTPYQFVDGADRPSIELLYRP